VDECKPLNEGGGGGGGDGDDGSNGTSSSSSSSSSGGGASDVMILSPEVAAHAFKLWAQLTAAVAVGSDVAGFKNNAFNHKPMTGRGLHSSTFLLILSRF